MPICCYMVTKMRLIRYELKKAVLSRGLKGICLALLVVSACLGFFCAEKPQYDVDAIERIAETYAHDPESVAERYEELRKAYEEYSELLYSDIDTDIAVPESIVEFEQYKLAFERINRQHTYIEKLDRTIRELKKYQSNSSDDRYSINEMLIGVYERNKTLRLGREDMHGLEELFALLSYLLFPLMTVGAFLGSTVAFRDRQRGNELLFRSTGYGRRHSLFAKIVSCLVCCTALSVAAVLVSVAVYSVSSGFGAFTAYIQNSDAFALFPLPLTVLESVFIIWAFLALACFFVCMVSCLVGKYSKNRVFPLVCSAGVMVLQFVAAVGEPNVAGSIWNIGSFGALCDGNILFSHIYAVVIGGKVVYGMLAVSFLYGICTVIMCTVFVLQRNRAKEHKPVVLPERCLPRHRTRVGSVYTYEWKKQLFANKTLLLILAAILIKIYVSLTIYNFEPTYTEQKYHSYMSSIQGEYTAEKHETLTHELTELYEIIGQKEEMERKYRANEITRNEMGAYLVQFYEAEQNEKALAKVCERLEYVKSQIESGKQPSMVYDTGWNQLFASQADLVLAVLIIAAMCGIYSDEYKNGMNRIYAVYNVKALHKSKVAFCIGLSVICVVVFSAVDTLLIAHNYSLPLFTTQASGIEGTAVLDTLPLYAYTLVRVLAECVFVCAFALAVAFLSYATKNKVLTFVLSSVPLLGVLLRI